MRINVKLDLWMGKKKVILSVEVSDKRRKDVQRRGFSVFLCRFELFYYNLSVVTTCKIRTCSQKKSSLPANNNILPGHSLEVWFGQPGILEKGKTWPDIQFNRPKTEYPNNASKSPAVVNIFYEQFHFGSASIFSKKGNSSTSVSTVYVNLNTLNEHQAPLKSLNVTVDVQNKRYIGRIVRDKNGEWALYLTKLNSIAYSIPEVPLCTK